jgi:hypothetical protein
MCTSSVFHRTRFRCASLNKRFPDIPVVVFVFVFIVDDDVSSSPN